MCPQVGKTQRFDNSKACTNYISRVVDRAGRNNATFLAIKVGNAMSKWDSPPSPPADFPIGAYLLVDSSGTMEFLQGSSWAAICYQQQTRSDKVATVWEAARNDCRGRVALWSDCSRSNSSILPAELRRQDVEPDNMVLAEALLSY